MRANIRVNSFWLGTFCLCIACNPLNYNPLNKSTLELNIYFNKDSFNLNESIICDFVLLNKSKGKIGIKTPLNIGYADDQTACLTLAVKKHTTEIKTAQNIDYQFLPSYSINTLEYGTAEKAVFDISMFYPLPDTGVYYIQGIFKDTVFSNSKDATLVSIQSEWRKVIIH